jgi:DNA-binding response OmpR family regulator
MKKILIVDDDREITESVRLALETAGYVTVVCHDGDQGLILTDREKPDLIILDMMMPKRSGFLVLETLRQTILYPLPIIIMTANPGGRHKAYAESLGVDGYIHKPFPIDVLLETIRRLVTRY